MVLLISELDSLSRPLRKRPPMANILPQMFQILRDYPSLLTAYQEDFLIHDVNKIKNAKIGDMFVWIVREHGTDLYPVDNANALVQYRTNSSQNNILYRLVVVTSVQDHLIGGTVSRLNKDEIVELANRKQVEKVEG